MLVQVDLRCKSVRHGRVGIVAAVVKPTEVRLVAERPVVGARADVWERLDHDWLALPAGAVSRTVSDESWRRVVEIDGVARVERMQVFTHLVPGPTTSDPEAPDAHLVLMVSVIAHVVETSEPPVFIRELEARLSDWDVKPANVAPAGDYSPNTARMPVPRTTDGGS